MTPEQQAAMRQALAFIRWNCFGECRTEGWDGPPPTAADTETALLQCLEQRPCKYPNCSYPCPDLPDCKDAEEENPQ